MGLKRKHRNNKKELSPSVLAFSFFQKRRPQGDIRLQVVSSGKEVEKFGMKNYFVRVC